MRSLIWAALALFATCATAAETFALRLNGHRLQVEYASTPAQRERGLMGRTELEEEAGMLFRFDDFRCHCLWMKNTPLPLSAAFLDEQGRIVDLLDLEPLSEAIRCSRKPARYALEVNQGWFERQGISQGTAVLGIPQR